MTTLILWTLTRTLYRCSTNNITGWILISSAPKQLRIRIPLDLSFPFLSFFFIFMYFYFVGLWTAAVDFSEIFFILWSDWQTNEGLENILCFTFMVHIWKYEVLMSLLSIGQGSLFKVTVWKVPSKNVQPGSGKSQQCWTILSLRAQRCATQVLINTQQDKKTSILVLHY